MLLTASPTLVYSLVFLFPSHLCAVESLFQLVEAVHLVAVVTSSTSSTLVLTDMACRENSQVQRQVCQGKALGTNPTFSSGVWLYGNYLRESLLSFFFPFLIRTQHCKPQHSNITGYSTRIHEI